MCGSYFGLKGVIDEITGYITWLQGNVVYSKGKKLLSTQTIR